MPAIVVLADDLTGATDVGAACLRHGIRSRIAALPDALLAGPEPLVVLNTRSRLLPAPEAVARITSLAAGIDSRLLNKTDSALRGPVGAELDAVLAVSGADRLVFVPAYPEAGRTTVGGVHRIHGVPVADSEFGRDPATPVTASRVELLLRQGTRRQVRLCTVADLPSLLAAPGRGELLVVEAETGDEVRRAAAIVARHDLPAAGPAGFLQALLGHLLPPGPPPDVPPPAGPLLAICGSRHTVTQAQIRAATAAGFIALPLTSGALSHPEVTGLAVAAHLMAGDRVLIDTAMAIDDRVAGLSTRLPGLLGDLAVAVVSGMAGQPLRLALCGGETAYGVLEKLGWAVLLPYDEPEPGACWSAAEGRADQVMTKSGAFGSEGMLAGLSAQLPLSDVGEGAGG